jgi:hypothetical protein
MNAGIDQNSRASLTALSNTGDGTIVTLYADPITHRLITDSAPGASGISGYSGFSGISGYSGFSGYSGTGPQGISGFSGYSGISGYSGTSGYSGANPGASGFSGYSGFSGISGFSGYSGAVGSIGTSGFSGYSGYSGISGFSGSSGTGDVTGPASATDNAIARYDNTTGKIIQDSAITVGDISGNAVVITTPSASTSTSIQLKGGNTSSNNANGGDAYNYGGAGLGSGNGGQAYVAGGAAGATGIGGAAGVYGGPGGATSGAGGGAVVYGGNATSGNSNGGSVILSPGDKTGSGSEGSLILKKSNSATYYASLELNQIASSNKTFTFPNTTGTLALTSDLNSFTQGITSRNPGTASNTVTIAHGLGKTPKLAKFTLVNSSTNIIGGSTGTYNGTNTNTVYYYGSTSGTSHTTNSDTTNAIVFADAGGSQVAVATFDATNITLVWTKTGSLSSDTTAQILWEATA